MAAVFGDEGLNFGEFPDLVAERFRIAPPETCAATATVFGFQGNDGGAVFDGDQGPGMLVVARLTAGFAVASFAGWLGLGVGMLGGRGLGGIAGCPVDPGLELFYFGQQNSDDGLSFRRLPCDHLFRDERFV